MSDPLLTSLCAICHIAKPVYTCPRCSIRTCSLSCVKKHKSWNSCNGERDATAFKPAKSLKTDPGVDHDYNYLYKMQRKIEDTEKDIIEERGLLQKKDLRPAAVKEVKWKPGRDGRKRPVVTTRILKERGYTMSRGLEIKLGQHGIKILHAPTGMQRQKDNKTSHSRHNVNWTVEWLKLQDNGEVSQRTLGRSLDDKPIYRAYLDWLDSANDKERQSRLDKEFYDETGLHRGSRYHNQVPTTNRWNVAQETVQEPGTRCWVLSGPLHATGKWPNDVDKERREAFDFFLANPRPQSADQPKVVTKLDLDDNLRDILSNTHVREFPTIYLLQKGATLPPGFVLGPKYYIEPQTQGTKRAAPAPKRLQKLKRRKTKDKEEGEVTTDGYDTATTDKGSVAGSAGGYDTDGSVPAGALEVGEVIAEQSFDEESDDSDATSDTSSEGTSSEDGSEEEGEIEG